ncbi:hypothetical protein [Ammonifex thiophilus]|uniref:Flagellar protein FliT n=1 Tax=Ammonifex thiophilus TaxID=444093 RepID=A0A3D8P630_9THEO|nr:hypothetical protein [Ammonifex thiophilus]RDV84790.1 hypothetical protein DXX99_01735 [Ammonifex thiophilus]
MSERILETWLQLARLQREAITNRQKERLEHILAAKECLRRLLEKEGSLPSGEPAVSLVREILATEEEARLQLLEWKKEVRQEIDMLDRWREWAKNLYFTVRGRGES